MVPGAGYALRDTYRMTASPGGETGIHKGLKIPRRPIPPCRFKSGPGHIQAQDRRRAVGCQVESDLGHGSYVPTTADRRRTLSDLIDKYTAEQLPRAYGSQAQRDKVNAQLNWWKDHVGHLTLEKLTPQAIAGARSELSRRR